jgi:hypothetical protein
MVQVDDATTLAVADPALGGAATAASHAGAPGVAAPIYELAMP